MKIWWGSSPTVCFFLKKFIFCQRHLPHSSQRQNFSARGVKIEMVSLQPNKMELMLYHQVFLEKTQSLFP
jgi:hypothetical protein